MAPIADAGGSVVEDPNGGGVGERWTILHAMADWRGAGGEQKTELMPGALFLARCLSLLREEFIPCFTSMRGRARAMFPGEVVEINLDNARIHLYSEDWNPDSKEGRPIREGEEDIPTRNGDVSGGICEVLRWRIQAGGGSCYRIDGRQAGARNIQNRETARGRRRAHPSLPPGSPSYGIPAGATEGRIRAQIRIYWSKGVRCGVFAGFCLSGLSRVVSHCDREAESLLGDEPQIRLEDDMAPLDEGATRSDADEDLGDMPDF